MLFAGIDNQYGHMYQSDYLYTYEHLLREESRLTWVGEQEIPTHKILKQTELTSEPTCIHLLGVTVQN